MSEDSDSMQQPKPLESNDEELGRVKSESLYRILFDSTNDAIFIHDMGRKFLEVNKVFCELLGYSHEELLQMTPADISSPEYASQVVPRLAELRQVGHAFFESAYVRRDGTIIPVELSTRIIEFKGKPAVLSVARDITERKRAEQKLRLQSEITENMFEGVVLTRASDGVIVYANPRFEQMFGYDPGELIGKNLAVVNAPVEGKSPEDTAREIEASMNESGTWVGEVPNIRKDGIHFWCRVNTSTLESSEYGRIWVSVQEDITERKKMEEELRRYSEHLEELVRERTGKLAESERKYRSLIVNMPDVVWTSDQKANTTFVSPNIEKVYGYAPEEIYEGGYNLWSRGIHPDDVERLEEAYQALFTRNEVFDVQYRYQRKDGQWIWLHDRATSTYEKDGVRYADGVTSDITERKRAEVDLQAAKDFAENLIQTAHAMVVGLDNHGNVRVFNQAAERITGYTQKELEGRNWFEVIAPKDRYPEVWAEFERLRAGGLPRNFENPILTKSGEERYVVWQNNEVREQGQVVGTISFGIDITERKRAEEELRATRERLEYVIGSNPAVIFTGRPRADYSDYDATYMSNTVAQMIGFQPKELIGNPRFWESRVHPDDLPRYHAELSQFWKEGHHVFEYRFLHKDGTYRWLREEARLIHDASGKPVEVIGYWTDITERRRMEEELRAARERLEYMITSNPAVIYAGKPLADHSDFVLTYVSDRVVAMLGFETREFIGHPEFWQRRVHPEDLRSVLAEMPRLWKEGQYSFDYRFLHKDGAYRWIREEAKVVRDADGKPIEVNGYWTDITERKHLEEALAKSQRLAAIGETSAMVGHDLRNPLQGIAGVVYLAKRNLESRKATDRRDAAGMLDTIQEQITYMDKIVSDLQDYAQPLTPKLTETNLPNLIRQTLSTVRIPKAVKVSVEVEKAAQNVMIDPTLMRRTFTNLAINAIQAMPKRGKLTVRARSKGNSTVMTVEDTGEGIAKKNLTKLFSPFFSTKAKGQGLGLAVCKRLVEVQGGTITVKSKPRKGTVFTIKLPRGKREVAS